LLAKFNTCRLANLLSCGGSASNLFSLKSKCSKSVAAMNSAPGTFSSLLPLKLSTNKDLAFAKPSGISSSSFLDKSRVASSFCALSNRFCGKDLEVNLFLLKFKDLKHGNLSKSTKLTLSTLFFFTVKCSNLDSLFKLSAGSAVMLESVNLSHL